MDKGKGVGKGKDRKEQANIGVKSLRKEARKSEPNIEHKNPYSEVNNQAASAGTVANNAGVQASGMADPGQPQQGSQDQMQLIRIGNHILRAALKYPELRGTKYESAEDAIDRFLEQYARFSAPLRDSQGRVEHPGDIRNDFYRVQNELHDFKKMYEELQTQHALEVDDMKRKSEMLKSVSSERDSMHAAELHKQQNAHQHEMNQLVTRFEDQLQKVREHEASRDKAKTDLNSQLVRDAVQWDKVVKRLAEDKMNLVRQVEYLTHQMEARQRDTEEACEKRFQLERQNNEKLIASLQADIKRRQEWIKDELDGRKEQLAVQQDERLRQLKFDHSNELETQRKDAEMRILDIQERYERIIKEMRRAIADFTELRKDVEQHRPRSRVTSQSIDLQLGQDHRSTILQLRSASGSMRKELIKEQPKGLRDHHIVGRMQPIANEIEQLSRIEWNTRRASSWPCTEGHMRQLHPQNTRRLKQYIVQSSLWAFLYQRVFRSPFCMFGAEGADLDRDWEDIYASVISPNEWPEISPETENKRCADAKTCLIIIDPTVEASDSDAKLNASYETMVAATVDTFFRLLQKIAAPGEQEKRSLEVIVRLSAKVWLELCSQEYRLLMDLKTPSGNVLAAAPAAMTSLCLVRIPSLRRFGSINGDDMTKEELVAGWRSIVESYPT